MRRVQWCYVILSGLVLWLLVGYAAKHHSAEWLMQLALATVYLAVIACLTGMIAPPRMFAMIRGWGWRVKVGLVFTYFSLILVLQWLIGVFWVRALTLAALFAVTYIALLILNWFLKPMVPQPPVESRRFDPAAPQGRRARFD